MYWATSPSEDMCFLNACGREQAAYASIEMYRQAPGGPTSAAVARSSTSPSPFRFSADQGHRNQSTGTCAVPCHRVAALGSRRPRNGGKLVVRPVPCDKFPLVRKPVKFQRGPIPEFHKTTPRRPQGTVTAPRRDAPKVAILFFRRDETSPADAVALSLAPCALPAG